MAYIKEEDDESTILSSEFGKKCAYFSGSFAFNQGTKKQIVWLKTFICKYYDLYN